MEYSNENLYVINAYKKNFTQKNNVVIYGVGIHTKAILSAIQDNNIVGLMDPLCEGSTIMGLPVLTIDEAINIAEVIVIVARQTVVPIIFERIKQMEIDYNIPIYNIDGLRLIEYQEEKFSNDIWYWQCNEVELKNKINQADVISFDIFDTLIIRDVLRPVDLFAFLERILKQNKIQCDNFVTYRQNAEDMIKDYKVANIFHIYNDLQSIYNWSDETTNKALELEFELELKACHDRKYMKKIYEYAFSLNKKIVLTSDMYLTQDYMIKLLERCGYNKWDKLYISCEYQKNKASGELYQVIKTDFNGKILHIGDNIKSDYEVAKIYDIDVYPIFSVYDLFINSSAYKLISKADTPDKMLILGIIAGKLFDNPYELCKTKGIIDINDPFLLGYCFISPVIICFVNWICDKLNNSEIDKVLFCARDGYIIEKLYNQRYKRYKLYDKLPKGIYFKTSRRAITVASLRNIDDILEILKRAYKTTKGELLKVRFGVNPSIDDSESNEHAISTENSKDVNHYILRYSDKILENAKTERKNYLNYIKTLGIENEDKIALYDFCSRGTIQYNLSKLLDDKINIIGLYFARMIGQSVSYERECKIETLFGDVMQYHSSYNITKKYMFLESVLSDMNETLVCVNVDNTFTYAVGENNLRNLKVLSMIHNGILAYGLDILKWNKIMVETMDNQKIFCDELFGLIFDKNCVLGLSLQKSIFADNTYDFEKPFNVVN